MLYAFLSFPMQVILHLVWGLILIDDYEESVRFKINVYVLRFLRSVYSNV
jgi:hypothetical protein